MSPAPSPALSKRSATVNPACETISAAGDVSREPTPTGSVVLASPLDDPAWDGSAGRHPDATPFHTAGWARVLNRTYGFLPLYLVQKTGKSISGLLALMEVKGLSGARRGLSLPFTDSCPMLLPRDEPASEVREWPPTSDSVGETASGLLRKAADVARERGWRTIELRTSGRRGPEAPASVRFLNHCVTLHPDDATQMAMTESSVRRSLRKAQECDLNIEVGTGDGMLRDYFQLHCLTRRRQGAPPQPFAFFRNLGEEMIARGFGYLVMAYHQSRPVAGAVFLYNGPRAVYKFGASDMAFQHLRPNNNVMWTGIRHAAKLGCTSLDFGRTSMDNEGLRRFKKGWGAVETEQGYDCFDAHTGRRLVLKDRTGGWQTTVFERLPLWASRLIGRFAYRYAA